MKGFLDLGVLHFGLVLVRLLTRAAITFRFQLLHNAMAFSGREKTLKATSRNFKTSLTVH